MKKFIIILLTFIFLFNFLYFSTMQVYAFDFVMTSLGVKFFATLLVVAGVTFVSMDSDYIVELYEYWKNLNPSLALVLANSAYTAVLNSTFANVDSSLWASIRDFARSHFKVGSHSEVVIEDPSSPGGGGSAGSSYRLDYSNTYWFDADYYTGQHLKVWQAVWPADELRSIKGYSLDSSDRLISPSGQVLVDPVRDFGGYYDEMTWNLYFNPNEMFEAEVSIAWLGAIAYTIGTVPVLSYDESHILIGVGTGTGTGSISLPVPYVGNPVLDNPNHDFEREGKREIGFPWLGSRPNVGSGAKDFYDGTIDQLLEETNSISQHLQTDLDRLLNLTGSDVISGSIDSARVGTVVVDGVPVEGLVIEKGFGVDVGTTDPSIPVPGENDLSGIVGLLQSILGGLGSLLDGIVSAISSIFTISDNVSLDFSPFQAIDLSSKFPFCIPWDLANSFRNFNSMPEVPIWTVSLLGTSFVLDFSIFEPWANIVRWGVLLLFNIGLIRITRNIIRS